MEGPGSSHRGSPGGIETGVGRAAPAVPFSGKDRRTTERQNLREPIVGRVRGLHFARVLNISPRGALAETASPLRPLARHELVIGFPDAPFVAKATVKRCRAWGYVADAQGHRVLFYRSGFEFDLLARQEVELLEYNLGFLDADAPRQPRPGGEAERAALLAERRLAREGGPIRIRVTTGRTPQAGGGSVDPR